MRDCGVGRVAHDTSNDIARHLKSPESSENMLQFSIFFSYKDLAVSGKKKSDF
jgi:hypothetical protein